MTMERDVYNYREPGELITFGMGCFWSPDALFGSRPGVIRTRVGYAGGMAESPTYRRMGDHTETVEAEFDPGVVSFGDLAALFWASHNPVNINGYKGRQYQSLLFYRNAEQLAAIEAVLAKRRAGVMPEPDTEILSYGGFHPAEEKHQKYYLKRHPDALAKLSAIFSGETLTGSTLAARLNGLAKGYTNRERIIEELAGDRESAEAQRLMALVKSMKW
ncbi:peptide-methionine (S)-S-oxide reductase MsrA [Paenibacillus methanolicus]|uniref:peptide-methionine (S)-S-oxide reductase n=1 Tax=Paenibacillus methanolicus TaxID=582686 RepID=A0A5S5BMA6_9BACL|nr:peptide-methionine (S)-S-oxide reductase [Paenibacillus methanolicus]TYP68094.1 peptide-methionine (S)-S-oxide reductase [Paenibacillus methanolicus]